ncbi:cell wall hydrolase [Paenibacillus tepidiphilus]|uniref:cell wall hydrolase n=1 Tax=Paenibacillus tepidiphilus TaxID=2608683 RepID=UPI001239ABD4|nr:cell wall hydrolase [Paenibacillus tepidiphilus]
MAYGDPLTSFNQLYGRDSADLLARTIYGEARGEISVNSRSAIAYVVINRKNSPYFPNTVQDVVLQQNAFSCWRTSDPNYDDCMAPNVSSAVWQECLNIALNTANYYNPIGSNRYYAVTSLFNNNSETRSDGKLYYYMSGSGWLVVTGKLALGNHTFFNLQGS